MILVKEIAQDEYSVCFEFDLNTICLWSKKQWETEFNKNGVKVIALLSSNEIIGICAYQVVIDEVHVNYLSIMQEFRRKGFGSYLMKYLIIKE